METKGMIDYIDEMLADEELTNVDRRRILSLWDGKLQVKMVTTTLISTELKEAQEVRDYIKTCYERVDGL